MLDNLSFIWITTADGVEKRLPTIRTPDGYYQVIDPDAPDKSYQEVLSQGENAVPTSKNLKSKGVLTQVTKETELNTVLRCEFFFEVWRVLGGSSAISGLTEEQEKLVKSISSPEAYYFNAMRWLIALGRGYLGRMYDWVDIANPITWSEVAYLFWGELMFPQNVDWRTMGETYKTSVLTEEKPGGGKTLVMDVNKYKSSVYFTDYLRHIRLGKRYLPYPLVGCYEELRQSNLLPHLRPDDILREVTRKEAAVLINKLAKVAKE